MWILDPQWKSRSCNIVKCQWLLQQYQRHVFGATRCTRKHTVYAKPAHLFEPKRVRLSWTRSRERWVAITTSQTTWSFSKPAWWVWCALVLTKWSRWLRKCKNAIRKRSKPRYQKRNFRFAHTVITPVPRERIWLMSTSESLLLFAPGVTWFRFEPLIHAPHNASTHATTHRLAHTLHEKWAC